MKIAFTGGGTGGHFYPIIAITEAIEDIVREKRLIAPTLYYLAPEPFDEKALFENSITFIRIPAGKIRRYTSIKNIIDIFITFIGIFTAVITLFRIYPDIVVSKGGFGSVPTVLAARLFHIPIIIHESDSKPGRANLLASKFAKKIAISFDSAAKFFPKRVQKKIARTGTPIRKALTRIETEGALQYLNLEKDIPTLLILGGSQGSVKINETILSALPDLVSFLNVIHQTGRVNFENMVALSKVVLTNNPNASRYHPIGYLDQVSMQRSASIMDIVVSRAGANSIAEISLWRKPSILIPIPQEISHDQRSNAYAYAQTGAAVVLEEQNLVAHLLVAEIKRIVENTEIAKRMSSAAKGFTDPGSAHILANEILDIALTHEPS